MLPEWFHTAPVWLNDKPRAPRRSGRFVRKALANLLEALAQELGASEGQARSPLSRLEPRAKVGGVVLLIIATTLVRRLEPLGGLLLAIAVLAVASRVSFRRLARVWIGVPLFSLAIVLPAMLNLVTDGPVLFTLCRLGPGVKLGPWGLPDAIAVTRPGALVAARLVLRTLDCVTLAFLLVATTEPSALLSGLRRLGMPRAFGMVLAMMQRYLALLLRASQDIHLARLSRSFAEVDVRAERRWSAAAIGSLFRRTRWLAEEIHQAMVSRGYDGDLQVRATNGIGVRDAFWLAAAMCCAAALIAADRII